MTVNTSMPLLQPAKLRHLSLPNRIVMARLTRMRAANPEKVPTTLHAEYYAQRASAGMIVSEGTFVSPASVGWADVQGLWSGLQRAAWRLATDAVREAGGRIHLRRASRISFVQPQGRTGQGSQRGFQRTRPAEPDRALLGRLGERPHEATPRLKPREGCLRPSGDDPSRI